MKQGISTRGSRVNVSKVEELLKMGDGDGDDQEEESGGSEGKDGDEDSFVMDAEERKEWRQKIRKVMSRIPDDFEEQTDMLEKRKQMQKLLAEYPLVVEEEDPDWPEDADGWGFSLGQFFNKISIKNVKKDDDENYDSENEIVWKDDDYIRPIKDITTAEWEEAIYKDISPLVVLVHNRYKRYFSNSRNFCESISSPKIVSLSQCYTLALVFRYQLSNLRYLVTFPSIWCMLYYTPAILSAC